MGNTDSIPVISQVKSLVQVIAGDEEGAKKTQENFSKQAPIVSQARSAYHALDGDLEQAKNIQKDFGDSAFVFAQGIPVVGHGISAGYAIAGDEDKARKIALGATKNLVVQAASAAGSLCGPEAPACSAALGMGASLAWDGVESGVRGERTGQIKGWHDLGTGEGSFDQNFDLISGTVMDIGDPAIEIFRGRRSIISDDYVPFDHTLPELPSQYLLKLPGSLKDIEIKEEMSSQAAVDAIFSVFLVLKLIGIGHIKSKPYHEEICNAFYPAMSLNECETTLFHAFIKYENQEEVVAEDFAVEKQDKASLFADVIDGLEFEAGSLSRHTTIGQVIETSACGDSEQCYIEVEAGIASLRKLERFLLGGRKRFKNYIVRNEKLLDVGKAKTLTQMTSRSMYSNKPNTFVADNNRGLTAHAMAQKNVGIFHAIDSSQAKKWKATSYEKISFDKNIPDSKVLGAFGYGPNVPIGGIKLSFVPRKD